MSVALSLSELPMIERSQEFNSKDILLAQRHNFQRLRQGLAYSCREIARRSEEIALQQQDPDLRFTHQAISKWFRGISVPSTKGRELLAIVFKTPREDIDYQCGIVQELDAPILSPVTVHVTDTLGIRHDYHLGVRPNIDFSRPLIFRDWTQLLSHRPGCISRHFKGVSDRLCGYTPVSISPFINRPRAVVLIETGHKAFDRLESPEKRLWFAYLPDGTLEISFLFVDEQGRNAIVAKTGDPLSRWRKFRRDQIDRVGYLGDRVLFYLDFPAAVPEPRNADPRGSILESALNGKVVYR
jgi:hypothetical protein